MHLLLDNGAAVDVATDGGRTPLHFAAMVPYPNQYSLHSDWEKGVAQVGWQEAPVMA